MSNPTAPASSSSSGTASSSPASSSASDQAKVHVNDSERDASAEFRQLREDVKGFRFEGIGNLRDISILDRRIRPGLIFRSGTPSQATPSDFIKLVLGIGLTTIVDLREHAEDSQDQGARSLLRVFSLAQHKHIEEIDHAATQDADAVVERIFKDTKAKPKYVEESGCPADAESGSKKQQVVQQQRKKTSGTSSPTGNDPGSGQGSSPKTWRKPFRRFSSSSRLLRSKKHSNRASTSSGADKADDKDDDDNTDQQQHGAGNNGSEERKEGEDADAEAVGADPEALGEDALKDPTSPLAEFANEALSMERSDTQEAPELEERHKSLDAQIDEFICTSEPLPRVKYYVPLAERKTMALALISAVSMRDRLKVAGQYLVGATIDKAKKQQAKMHMLKRFDEMGLFGLNKIILRYSQHSLCRALKIIATRRHHPVLVHCFHGKDRTGLVIAIVLRLLGVPAQRIADDYHLSEEHGMSDAGRAHFEKVGGLTVDKWCRAPRRVIVQTLRHIDTEYHGIKAYCTQIGFDEAWQKRLREVLLLPASKLAPVSRF